MSALAKPDLDKAVRKMLKKLNIEEDVMCSLAAVERVGIVDLTVLQHMGCALGKRLAAASTMKAEAEALGRATLWVSHPWLPVVSVRGRVAPLRGAVASTIGIVHKVQVGPATKT